ncbi:response regulator [candidate division KSB1 bacterium]|nr:response regulator [candidate division KSB1 bacterium]
MNNLRVLIAGTSSSYLEISKKILKFHYHDCEVDFALSGSQCIEKALKSSYDIVLFDYQMGDRTGLEVIDSLKTSNNRMLLIPLIDEGDEGKAIQSMEKGATDYIIKARGYLTALPFTMRNILERKSAFKRELPTLKLVDEPDVHEGHFILDRKGRILSANQNMAKITNYSNEELLELTFTDLLPKDQERLFNNQLDLITHNGKSIESFKTEILGKMGNKMLLNIILTAVRDDQKRVVSYRGKVERLTADVKTYRTTEAEIDQLKMIDQISQAIISSYDEPLNVLLEKFSEIACQIFGFQRSTIALLDKRKKAYIKQSMTGFPVLTSRNNTDVEVPKEIVDKIFSNKFLVKLIYYNQSHRHSTSQLNAKSIERRTQKRRPENKWHQRDLILVNLLVRNGDSFGYISLDSPTSKSQPARNAFHNLELFGRLISMAIENYYQFSELEKRSRRLKQILVTSNIFKLYLSLNDLLKEVVWSIKFSLDFNLVALGLVSKRSGNLEIKAVACDDKNKRNQLHGLAFPLDPLAELFRAEYNNGKSFLVEKEEEILYSLKKIYYGDKFNTSQNGGWPTCGILLVPVKSRASKIIGLLMVDDPVNKKLPTKDVIKTLEILANQIAVAIDNRVLYVQMKEKNRRTDKNGQQKKEKSADETSGIKGFVDRIFK